jgi:hypothetical protein
MRFHPFPRLRGKVGMGVRVSKGSENFPKDVLSPSKDIVVPESEHRIPFPAEPGIALGIRVIAAVLSAVDLDNQAPFEAGEVRDVGPYRMLSTKAASVQLAAAQILPHALLGIGHATAQSPCQLLLGAVSQDSPPSRPSPASGGRGLPAVALIHHPCHNLKTPTTFLKPSKLLTGVGRLTGRPPTSSPDVRQPPHQTPPTSSPDIRQPPHPTPPSSSPGVAKYSV